MKDERKKLLKSVGRKCKVDRIAHGIYVYEMARMTGYSEATICKFENGQNNNLELYFKYRSIFKSMERGVNNGENSTGSTNT